MDARSHSHEFGLEPDRRISVGTLYSNAGPQPPRPSYSHDFSSDPAMQFVPFTSPAQASPDAPAPGVSRLCPECRKPRMIFKGDKCLKCGIDAGSL